ncbi:uncharacterized protein LOC120431985 [Culex pipiens pallens]|uniref:uncharacterized protein LOC120431985 n=1 Tax=Culex pipiens pallens TaxID=42434 RepID=UPI001954F001|nr:uncharacterized protein LOC120431985 [Culex pipiens pallens]
MIMEPTRVQKIVKVNSISLNDALAVGPVVQDDLFSLILRFRLEPFVLVTYIEKIRWKKFVPNRVSEIQEVNAGHVWLHVPGLDNPVDVISRRMTATQLIDCMLWWQGSSWLRQCSRFWPCIVRTSDDLFDKEQLEERPVDSLPAVAETSIFGVTSSLSELIRKVAYYRRFSYNARGCNRSNRRVGLISIAELNESLRCLAKLAQQESFPKDLHAFRTTGQVESTSKLKSLPPILMDGVLRTRDRLQHADVPYDRKHPIILDNKYSFTLMIMGYNHLKYLHAGPQLLIAAYVPSSGHFALVIWLENLSTSALTVDCPCKPRTSDQIMGYLPAVRVLPILLGLISAGLSTYDHHIARLPHRSVLWPYSFRFAARRGVPKTLFCDNGINFVGARRTLNEFLRLLKTQQVQDQVVRSCSADGIQFQFIPPRTPYFGGIWEAAVKSLKNQLRRTVGNANLTAEQMSTFLAQAEACSNSRPLTPISNNPDDLDRDLDVLTPAHFLVHRPLIAIPEPLYEEIATNRMSQWQMIQEYLRPAHSVDSRKRQHPHRDNGPGDNLPPQKWRIGRVIEIFPGNDGHVRVVKLRTPDGLYTRAITRLCVLPIDDNQQPAQDSQ